MNRQASFNTFEEKKKGLSLRAGVVKIKDFFTKALSMKTTFVKKVIIIVHSLDVFVEKKNNAF